MRNHLIAILLFLFLLLIPVMAMAADSIDDHDRRVHIAWGIGTGAVISKVSKFFGFVGGSEAGLAGAVLAGVVKTVTDKSFDSFDALATIGGGLISYAADQQVRLMITPSKTGAVMAVVWEF